VVAALVLAFAPTQPAATAQPDRDDAHDYDWQVLTPGPERYVLSTEPGRAVTVRARPPAASADPSGNRRQVLVRSGARPSRDQTACATWVGQSASTNQEGLAVRVGIGPGDRLRAVTVTKNTYGAYDWVFNLLTWDSRRPGDAWRGIGQFDMSGVVSAQLQLLPFPWRVCLRAEGRAVGFKVWLPDREPEPSWSDAEHTGWARVTRGFVRPGVPGWYVGHLLPGDKISYAAMTAETDRR